MALPPGTPVDPGVIELVLPKGVTYEMLPRLTTPEGILSWSFSRFAALTSQGLQPHEACQEILEALTRLGVPEEVRLRCRTGPESEQVVRVKIREIQARQSPDARWYLHIPASPDTVQA